VPQLFCAIVALRQPQPRTLECALYRSLLDANFGGVHAEEHRMHNQPHSAALALPPMSVVIFKHAMRNALIPVVTLFGLSIPVLLGGAAVTETIFSWPGLGFLGVQAVITRDYPLVLAFVMIGGILVVLGNLVADVLYATVDPRIKY